MADGSPTLIDSLMTEQRCLLAEQRCLLAEHRCLLQRALTHVNRLLDTSPPAAHRTQRSSRTQDDDDELRDSVDRIEPVDGDSCVKPILEVIRTEIIEAQRLLRTEVEATHSYLLESMLPRVSIIYRLLRILVPSFYNFSLTKNPNTF